MTKTKNVYEFLTELNGHQHQVWNICWSPTKFMLISTGTDKTIRFWKPQLPSQLTLHSHHLDNHKTSNETERLAQEEEICSFLKKDWKLLSVIDDAHKRTIRAVAMSPDGKTIASASFDGATNIWAKLDHPSMTIMHLDEDNHDEKEYGETESKEDFECLATLEGHENEVKSVAWSVSNQYLATCGRDKSVWIWEVTEDGDFECISVLQEHTQDVKMVTWSPVEDILLSASYDDTLKIWKEDQDDWFCETTLKGHTSTVWAADFNADGSMIVSVSDDRSFRIWKKEQVVQENSSLASRLVGWTRKETRWECVLCVPDLHDRAIYSVSWSKQHGLLLTAGSDNKIKICRLSVNSSSSEQHSVTSNNSSTTTTSAGNVHYSFEVLETINEPHGKRDINCVQWYQGPTSTSSSELSYIFASCGDDEKIKIWKLNL